MRHLAWAWMVLALVSLVGCGSFGLSAEDRTKIITDGVKLAGDEAHQVAYDKALAAGLSEEDATAAGLVARTAAELAAKVVLEKSVPQPEPESGGSKFGGFLAAIVLALIQGVAGRKKGDA